MRFLLTNSGCFSSSAAFRWSNWEQYLLDLLGFPEGAHNRELPSNPTIYTRSPSLDEDQSFGVVGAGSFCLSPVLFHSTLLYSIHFSLPITIHFKNGTLSLYFSKDSHVKIQSRRFFCFCLFNLYGTQTPK